MMRPAAQRGAEARARRQNGGVDGAGVWCRQESVPFKCEARFHQGMRLTCSILLASHVQCNDSAFVVYIEK